MCFSANASAIAVLLVLLSPGTAAHGAARITRLDPASAGPGSMVSIWGEGFGTRPGTVVLTGRRIAASAWADTRVSFTVPDDSASGGVLVRTQNGVQSESAPFMVDRPSPPDQMRPYGLRLEDTGLPGAAFLVETDGTHLYGITGFETLCMITLLTAN